MAKSTIKLRTKEKGGKVQVKALITHPMETGLRKDKKTGDKIPAHYITEVKVEANGKTVLTADWSGSVSKNPFISFNYAGSKGDKVKLTWTDNMGKSDSIEKEVGKK
ncbi:thiosulfate oxidation carrier complex protein SoxZ [Cocleimonas flava]|jgi:sulfur-oxidizing protein SoxZ|uniref:Sulfur compound chelating protein SoxZ n=1 Tax=Cocleimonas flava TaxID=634765 RepID=A0A4R1FEP4_9GAMM|nr:MULTISPECIES: thiosulfate oxidation carrier complex protein SoxZ [Cocleimonas]MEB8431673.1 thiosulfate oxidation carrier complex protein SoxZ [Cocleimonas sp. KMM 6892]MEC4713555.1 thiosulfate oxidation carrier complex protein SoxZ [Cocleimonas sp. KMM 6895]MEC4742886.1 thiosulfate oxidation carrier complex protein SoxZ [Cocleimonas sp. KMM 6896]TCJ89361.1 sulfur compound chelating protein SoxZ [Cocleimonas flava]